ncbi:MAG TPA: hypothetical protein VK824_05915, partial [Planctomycetota bacterium]|nr:hypothetical protein [Planctomycetota bacterium]
MSGTGRPAIITRLTLLAAGCVAPGRTLAAPDGVTGFGERVAAVPDLDHDGTTDLAVSTRSGLPLARLFSGATGAPLGDLAGLELPTPWGSHPDAPRVCAVLGADAECAGLVVGAPNRQRDGHFCGWVGMYAPATQRLVWESWGEDEMEVRGVALAPLPDVNGDGLQDVAVGTGECEAEPGQWLSGRVLVLSGGSGAVLGEFRAP